MGFTTNTDYNGLLPEAPPCYKLDRISFLRRTALRAVVEINYSFQKECETAMCPVCHALLEVRGHVVELRVADQAAEASA